MANKEYRKVNKSLNQNPTLFGIIPVDRLIPVGIMMFVAILPMNMGASWMVSLIVFLIEIISYGCLTAKGSWKLEARLKKPPEWIQGGIQDKSLLDEFAEIDRQQAAKQKQKKQK